MVETYSYDSQNRLTGYTDGTTTAVYVYDALDRRIAKTVDGVTTAFVYDPWSVSGSTSNDVLMDFEDGVLTKRWLHGPRVDEPLGFERYAGTTAAGAGTEHELYADRMGSVTEVVEAATGTVAASYTYDSFGNRTHSGTLDQRYGFTGREADDESGLIYFRARHYDPALGQFIQRDPIGFAAGDMNLYAYVGNDPYNWSDPSGLGPEGTSNDARTASIVLGTVSTATAAVYNVLSGPMRLLACYTATLNAMAGHYFDATFGGFDCLTGTKGSGKLVTAVKKKADKILGACSFHGATLVETKAGPIAISNIVIGDMVWARNETTGEMGWRAVQAVFAEFHDEIVRVTIRDVETRALQTIASNRVHPYFVQIAPAEEPQDILLSHSIRSSEGHLYSGPIANGHWIDAADLQPGYRLLNGDQSWAEVVSVKVEEAPLDAYNLSVEEFHTYFVAGSAGADAVWVHNACFKNKKLLDRHFRDHGGESGAQTADAYRKLAGDFLSGPKAKGVLEKVRPSNGDVMRFDPLSNAFGVITKDGVVRTFFKVGPRSATNPRGYDPAKYSSALDYFNAL